jgi:hypothetical protein
MRAMYAVARREMIEKKFVFAAALAVSAIVPLIPVLRGMTGGSGRELRGFLAVFAAWSFAGAVAAGLGASVLATEVARGRAGFYFSRPLSSVSIWLGKLAGSVGLALAAGLIVVAPTLLMDGRLEPLAELAGSTGRGLLLAASGVIVLFLFSHAASTIVRSRSLLALADLLLAAAVGFLTWDALHRLIEVWPDPSSLMRRAAAAGALAAGAVLVAAMHRGVERGRTDPAAAHRALSVTLWSGLLVAGLGVTVYSRWVLSAPASALHSFESASPLGSEGWIALDGVARGAKAQFLYDTRTGRSQRVSGSEPIVSANGSTAAWAQRESRNAPWIVRTMRLNSPDVRPFETRAHVTSPGRMFLSADGSRLGSIEGGILSVAELPSGKLLASVRIGQPSTYASGVFAGNDLVRVYASLFGIENPLSVLELDVPARTVVRTGTAPSPRAWYWGSPLHDRFIETDKERRVWTLHDGRSGARLKTLREGGPLSFGAAAALADGRWALLFADDARSWLEVFSPSGERLSSIAIGPKGILRAGGEIAPGKLTIEGPGARRVRSIYVVDLDRGTATRNSDGLRRPIHFWRPADIRPGSEATKLYLEESKALVRFDPETGERRVLLRSSSPD